MESPIFYFVNLWTFLLTFQWAVVTSTFHPSSQDPTNHDAIISNAILTFLYKSHFKRGDAHYGFVGYLVIRKILPKSLVVKQTLLKKIYLKFFVMFTSLQAPT